MPILTSSCHEYSSSHRYSRSNQIITQLRCSTMDIAIRVGGWELAHVIR